MLASVTMVTSRAGGEELGGRPPAGSLVWATRSTSLQDGDLGWVTSLALEAFFLPRPIHLGFVYLLIS